MISLEYQAAGENLAGLVSSFYRFDYEGDNLSELERADRAQFRFQLRGTGHYRFSAGHKITGHPVTIFGPTTAPVTAIADCPQTIVGWGMEPAGWAALMGSDSERWVDNAFDASDVFGDTVIELRQRLIETADMQSQFDIMQRAATDIFAKLDHAPFEFTAIVDSWLIEDQDHVLATLIDASGLSQRQLERMTKRYYGLPPKKLARKYRALHAAQILAQGDSLDDSELGLAFYDQSHLVREVKQFTGMTPTQLRAGKAELTKATMRGRKAMDGKVSKLISDS
ncbi:MAG: helix-turn-helix domain-containing protein [Sphingorhabdus sp.]